jgi:uncharacterized protein (TIGR02996 family)
MNIGDSLLLDLANAPGDREPALILADWLEERDTPAARALAPIVRLAAQKRTAAWRKQMAAARTTLAATRPQAAGWLDWWFGTHFGPTFRLLRNPERLPLVRFGIRCVRDLPAGGKTVFDHLTDPAPIRAMEHIERSVIGDLLPEEDREHTRMRVWDVGRQLVARNDPHMYPVWAIIMLFSLALPPRGSAVRTLIDANECATYSLRAAYDIPPVQRHKVSPEALVLGYLRATVPCPFDPETDP